MSKGLKSKLSKLRYDGAITDSEYQELKKGLDDKVCRVMVVWSNGTNLRTELFEGKTEGEAIAAARTYMHNAYDENNSIIEAEEELGAYREDNECLYMADGADSCIWSLIRMQ